MTSTHTWIIDGERTMHCGGCAKTIEFTLLQLSGVERVDANFHTQRIEVAIGDEQDVAHIVGELAELDYTVKEVSNDDHASN